MALGIWPRRQTVSSSADHDAQGSARLVHRPRSHALPAVIIGVGLASTQPPGSRLDLRITSAIWLLQAGREFVFEQAASRLDGLIASRQSARDCDALRTMCGPCGAVAKRTSRVSPLWGRITGAPLSARNATTGGLAAVRAPCASLAALQFRKVSGRPGQLLGCQ